jgi:N-acetylmuramoyl-L-alanine amidase
MKHVFIFGLYLCAVVGVASSSFGSATQKRAIFVDPGQQLHGDSEQEKVSPSNDDRRMKDKSMESPKGVVTRIPAFKTNLKYSTDLCGRFKKSELINKLGLNVVISRDTNDVRISNKERADKAKEVNAIIVVRLFCNYSKDKNIRGVQILYPVGKAIPVDVASRSKKVAEIVLKKIRNAGVEIKGEGLVPTDYLTTFNYCGYYGIPAIAIMIGCISNIEDDKLVNTNGYQSKINNAICEAVVEAVQEGVIVKKQ